MSVKFKLWIRKLWNGYKSIAVEIAALLFMTSVLMTYLIMQDLVLARVCRVNLGYSNEVCEAVVRNTGNYSVEETNIQKIMTHIRKARAILDYSIPILFVLLQGSWSDIYGRKLPLLLPCVGFILQASALAMTHFFQNLDGYTVVFIATIPKCLSGADVTFRMAALSYVSDISTKRDRTLRTGLLSAAFSLGVPIGFALGGAAVKAAIKPEISFLVSAGISATAFLNIAIFVDNKPLLSDAVTTTSLNTSSCCNNVVENQKPKSKRKCMSVENLKSVMKSLVLSFDGVPSSVRVQIVVLVVAIIFIIAPIQGEFGITYLYLRKKLAWDLGDYGLFSTYVSMIGVIGTILSMGILCSLLKLTDPVIGVIAGFSQFSGCFMYAFAYTNWMIYLAPAIDMLNGTMAVVAKSMLSKLCPVEDFGKMFSFLAIIELLVPLVFDPTYSSVYEQTMDVFPGCVFLLSAALTVPPQLTFLFYAWKNRNVISCDITDSVSVGSRAHKVTSKGKCKNLESVGGENYIASHPSSVILKSATSAMTVDTVHNTNDTILKITNSCPYPSPKSDVPCL